MSPAAPQAPPPVVTISASFGSGGSVVGPALAERLGVQFLDRAIPVAVSNELEVPLDEALAHEELAHRSLSRWLAFFVPGAMAWTGAQTGIPTAAEEEAFRQATEEVLRQYAADGGVFLGRAGAIVLRGVPGALHVRLHAAAERRVLQGMRLENVDRETAERELRASDLARETYVKHWYHTNPNDPTHYHLVLDSTSIALDTCVDMIETALRARTAPRP